MPSIVSSIFAGRGGSEVSCLCAYRGRGVLNSENNKVVSQARMKSQQLVPFAVCIKFTAGGIHISQLQPFIYVKPPRHRVYSSCKAERHSSIQEKASYAAKQSTHQSINQ